MMASQAQFHLSSNEPRALARADVPNENGMTNFNHRYMNLYLIKTTVWMICFIFIHPIIVSAGNMIYVDQCATSVTRDGLTWCTAFAQLTEALNMASIPSSDITDIRVAQGIYTPPPTNLPDARDATVQLINGVSLMGGFAGCCGAIPDQRDTHRFETIITGDMNLDDDFKQFGDNSFHVITGNGTNSSAVLDGFTVTNGYAHGDSRPATRTGDRNVGAGMVNVGASPTVRNCIFQNNDADTGGGMKNLNSSVTVINTIFRHNNAAFNSGGGSGGGMDNEDSTPTIINCTFKGNTAGGAGGGLYVFNSHPTIYNSIFWDNSDAGPQDETAQIDISVASVLTIENSCIQDINPDDASIPFGGITNANIDDNPLFIASNTNLRLQINSPCIDAADQNLLQDAVMTDLDAHARLLCDEVDMGAYESGIGDRNCDAKVSQSDFEHWPICMNGPIPSQAPLCCKAYDYAADHDVDLLDFAAFQSSITAID